MTDQQRVTLTGDQFTQLLQRSCANTGGNGTSKSVKPVRPSVDVETAWGWMVDISWSMGSLQAYGQLGYPVGNPWQFRQCCCDQLNRRLFDIRGASALNNVTEVSNFVDLAVIFGELLLWTTEGWILTFRLASIFFTDNVTLVVFSEVIYVQLCFRPFCRNMYGTLVVHDLLYSYGRVWCYNLFDVTNVISIEFY